MSYNGKILDSIAAKAKNMTCDRATLYKNYYTYLYGLPMKLKMLAQISVIKLKRKPLKAKTIWF